MIVASQKNIDELWNMAQGFKKIMVTGCNTCVAICHQGGGKEAETIASLLRVRAGREGRPMEIVSSDALRHCEPEYLEEVKAKLDGHDLVISTACGVGVNMLSSMAVPTPVYPGVNTTFYGAVEMPGFFTEMCAGCGDCVLHLTGGICPIVRCSKSLLNGPCGGTNKGKCEVSDEIDCAWFLIVERMKQLGTLDKLTEILPARNWSSGTHGGPRRLVVEHIQDMEKASEEKKA